jgi:hypothetical protein
VCLPLCPKAHNTTSPAPAVPALGPFLFPLLDRTVGAAASLRAPKVVALRALAGAAVIPVMGTKSREVIWGGQIMGAKIHARHAREEATKAAREADRAEAYAWSVQMEGYGGPAQPSPTIGQCLNGGLSWLEVECNRCKTQPAPWTPSAGRGTRRSGSWKPR